MSDAEYQNPYLLMTPGPLSTTPGVRRAMARDWCTWDDDYKEITEDIRRRLLQVAECSPANYTTVLLQGSGTYVVESVLTTSVGDGQKVLILQNGAYGRRMVAIAETARIPHSEYGFCETEAVNPARVANLLDADRSITHVAFVHCETTTGILNPLSEVVEVARQRGVKVIVDAMSSFGGIHIPLEALDIDYLISSANKCIQGVPGFGFVIAKQDTIRACKGQARSHSLDLYDQWRVMEQDHGKWRFTSPTHTVRAFHQALLELEAEGGVKARQQRYLANQQRLVAGLVKFGFHALLPVALQSPIITSFPYPTEEFSFEHFYAELKEQGYVIYPGKLSEQKAFRIGTIGDIHPLDIDAFLGAVEKVTSSPNVR